MINSPVLLELPFSIVCLAPDWVRSQVKQVEISLSRKTPTGRFEVINQDTERVYPWALFGDMAGEGDERFVAIRRTPDQLARVKYRFETLPSGDYKMRVVADAKSDDRELFDA